MNIIEDILKHPDEEVIAYMAKTMQGIIKNYDVSVQKGQPELLWGNIGDLTMVTQVLRAMNKRNEAKLAQSQPK